MSFLKALTQVKVIERSFLQTISNTLRRQVLRLLRRRKNVGVRTCFLKNVNRALLGQLCHLIMMKFYARMKLNTFLTMTALRAAHLMCVVEAKQILIVQTKLSTL